MKKFLILLLCILLFPALTFANEKTNQLNDLDPIKTLEKYQDYNNVKNELILTSIENEGTEYEIKIYKPKNNNFEFLDLTMEEAQFI